MKKGHYEMNFDPSCDGCHMGECGDGHPSWVPDETEHSTECRCGECNILRAMEFLPEETKKGRR